MGAFLALLGGLAAVAEVSGLRAWLSVDSLRGLLDDAGPAGVGVFLVVYALSNLVSVPALVFVFAALLSFGGGLGLAVAFGGGLLAASTSFLAVRLVRGRPAAGAPPPSGRLQRLLAPLERHPVRTVALLRVLFVLSGPVNMALATSRVRFGAYLAGTALGLVPPLAFYSLTLECWLGG